MLILAIHLKIIDISEIVRDRYRILCMNFLTNLKNKYYTGGRIKNRKSSCQSVFPNKPSFIRYRIFPIRLLHSVYHISDSVDSSLRNDLSKFYAHGAFIRSLNEKDISPRKSFSLHKILNSFTILYKSI